MYYTHTLFRTFSVPEMYVLPTVFFPYKE